MRLHRHYSKSALKRFEMQHADFCALFSAKNCLSNQKTRVFNALLTTKYAAQNLVERPLK